MRRYDVFGHKKSQVRPLYLLIVIFAVMIPGYFALNYFQGDHLEELENQTSQLESEINLLIEQVNQDVEDTISQGMIESGFQYRRFDYDIQEDIISYIEYVGLAYESDDQLTVSTSDPPFDIDLPSDIVVKAIDLTLTIDDIDKFNDFIEILQNQDQLFYVDYVSVKGLVDGDYRIEMTFYGFYQSES